MKFSIYLAIDLTDGTNSLFLVREDNGQAISIFYVDDCQIEYLKECAPNHEQENWYSSEHFMHEPELIESFEI